LVLAMPDLWSRWDLRLAEYDRWRRCASNALGRQNPQQGYVWTGGAKVQRVVEHNITWHFIAPGKPMQNGFCRALMVECGMSFSMKPCSSASITPEPASRITHERYIAERRSLSKKVGPRISPRPDPTRAGYIRPRPPSVLMSSRQPPLSNYWQQRQRMINAPRQCAHVPDG
ncbi:MAG: putative transposase, partial [Bradyrhizobium sp.]|nr:putative transposase [Bradyrhizobium sp.]